MTEVQRGLTAEQQTVLMQDLRPTRVSTRSQGGKTLSYVEAWDIKAHLTRIFGFANWDSEVTEFAHVGTRDYQSQQNKDMVEVIYRAKVQLTIRDQHGNHLCRHSEVAVGSTSGPANMLGEHHDNAVKTAASDALKRCAINLGTQFGLSLYNDGSKSDVIKRTIVHPGGWAPAEPDQAAVQTVTERLGATPVEPESLHVVSLRARLDALSKGESDSIKTWWAKADLPKLADLSPQQAAVVNGQLDAMAEAGKRATGAKK